MPLTIFDFFIIKMTIILHTSIAFTRVLAFTVYSKNLPCCTKDSVLIAGRFWSEVAKIFLLWKNSEGKMTELL